MKMILMIMLTIKLEFTPDFDDVNDDADAVNDDNFHDYVIIMSIIMLISILMIMLMPAF